MKVIRNDNPVGRCKNCGCEFEKRYFGQIFCSDDCKQDYRDQLLRDD